MCDLLNFHVVLRARPLVRPYQLTSSDLPCHSARVHAHRFVVQVAITPNPWGNDVKNTTAFFNQTLDLASASVLVYAGGTSLDDYTLRMRLYVDANSDALLIDVAARDASTGAFALTAHVSSVRAEKGGNPDVFVDPLLSPMFFSPAPPIDTRDTFGHPSGARRPSRTLAAAGKLAAGARIGFAPGSVVVYHRNNALVDGTPVVNRTLSEQACESLIATTPDHWSDLQSGFALDGGSGPALKRVDSHTLASTVPSTLFQLRATVLAMQTNTPAEWIADVAALISSAAPDPRSAHEGWWSKFWDRSWVMVNSTTTTSTTTNPALQHAPTSVDATPPPGAALWLTAESLAGAANGSTVDAWPGKGGSPGVAQANATQRPSFVLDAFGKGRDGVRFDGVSSFLGNSTLALAPNSSFFAVFR
jgi:hypothetical protein